MSSFQQQKYCKTYKEIIKYESCSGKKKVNSCYFLGVQLLESADKDFKAAVVNMLK